MQMPIGDTHHSTRCVTIVDTRYWPDGVNDTDLEVHGSGAPVAVGSLVDEVGHPLEPHCGRNSGLPYSNTSGLCCPTPSCSRRGHRFAQPTQLNSATLGRQLAEC